MTTIATTITQLCVVSGVGLVIFGALFWYFFLNDPFDDWWFDEQIWKAQHHKNNFSNPRGKMASDLKHRVLTTTMTQQQVLNLLGPPDWGQDKTYLSYSIGDWSGFRMDGDIFVVEFGAAGKVTQVYWYQT